jgi:hypothetical protein
MSGQPDAAKYEALVERLLDIERCVSAAEIDPLTSSIQALEAILAFLCVDTRIIGGEGTRSLGRLLLALHDRVQGAKPKLFFQTPDRKGRKGAPSYTSAIFLRSVVNYAFIPLLKSGLSNEEASEWLAAELKQSGINQPNGRAVDARTIVRWRAELGGKSLTGSDRFFGEFVQGAQRTLHEAGFKPDEPLDARRAKVAAQVSVKLLKAAGF